MLRLLLMFFVALIALNIFFKVLGFAIAVTFKLTVIALVIGAGIMAFNYFSSKKITRM